MKAEKIIKLVLDQELHNQHFEGDEHMGAFLLKSALNKHFQKHIQSFMGKTRFVCQDSEKKIGRLLHNEVSFYCRSILHGEEERMGAEKMLKHIREEFYKIIKE